MEEKINIILLCKICVGNFSEAKTAERIREFRKMLPGSFENINILWIVLPIKQGDSDVSLLFASKDIENFDNINKFLETLKIENDILLHQCESNNKLNETISELEEKIEILENSWWERFKRSFNLIF